jgi:cytoskeleton protein RodZ
MTPDNGGELDRLPVHSRKVSTEADVLRKSVGQDLYKARQRSGKELADVWCVLKIRPDYLVAIEEGRFEALPAPVYAIGYVRSYAAYLGLDADVFVDRLKAEFAQSSDAKVPIVGPPPQRKVPQGARVITGLVLVALIYSGYYLFASVAPVPRPPVTPVPERLAAIVARLPPETVAATAPMTAKEATPILPPKPAVPAPAELASAQPVSVPSEPAPKIEAPLPSGRRYGVQNRNSRITLRVHRPTRVAVQGARNRTFVDRTLAPGDTYRVPNMVGLRLTTPDAGAVEVILDGSPVGFAGKDGVTARGLSLNPQNVMDRQQRG